LFGTATLKSDSIAVGFLLSGSFVHLLSTRHVGDVLLAGDLADEFFGAWAAGGDGAFEGFGVAVEEKMSAYV
jgi:hypothetical protein